MKIAVIGCGWLGLPVGEELIEQGHQVVGTTTSQGKIEFLESKGIETHILDLKEDIINFSFLKNCDRALICFPPGLRKENHSFPRQIERLISGLSNKGLNKIIFISSTGVYPSHGIFNENLVINEPISSKQSLLLNAEKEISQQFNTLIIRMGGLFGGTREPHNFIKSSKQFETNTEVNLIHQSDAVNLCIKSILNDKTGITNGVHPHHPLKHSFYKECFKRKDKDFIIPPPSKYTQREINSNRLTAEDFLYESLYEYL